MDKDLIMSYGIDSEKGLKNCMGNPSFYKKILSMFLNDRCFALGKAAYLDGDMRELFNRMHELKGISGNAALTALYEATVPLVEVLRGGTAAQEDVDRLFPVTEEAYRRTCEGIAIILAEA